MTLAMILGVCSLLVSLHGASPAVRALLVIQATQTQPESPPSDSSQNPAQSTEQKAETAPAQPQASQPPVEKTPSAAPIQPSKTKAATASKTTPKKHSRRKKPAAQPSDGPTKVIVRNGGAPDPTVQLSPGVSTEQASRQRQATNQLLTTTEANLKTLAGRELNPSQQDTVSQVRGYMKQAKAAADAGDLQRAHNLAFKAKLLSDEVAKR